MLRILSWLVILVIAVVVVTFAWWNHGPITVSLWPLPDYAVPLYMLVLGALAVGFLFGQLIAWIRGGTWRREARRRARRIEALERELAATQARLANDLGPGPGPARGNSAATRLPTVASAHH